MSTKKVSEPSTQGRSSTGKVEVRVGITDSPREITIELSNSADEIESFLAKAMADNSHLALTDEKGRRVIVPAAKIGFIEVSARAERKVGFGTN